MRHLEVEAGLASAVLLAQQQLAPPIGRVLVILLEAVRLSVARLQLSDLCLDLTAQRPHGLPDLSLPLLHLLLAPQLSTEQVTHLPKLSHMHRIFHTAFNSPLRV